MKCVDDHCRCLTHVTPQSHVPCCPYCRWPLRRAEHAYTIGACLLGCPHYFTNPSDTEGTNPWLWLPRDLFNGDELPPHNGFAPIQINEGD